jgi:rubrerythrin
MALLENKPLFAIFSNLSKAAEKQQLNEMAELYSQLSDTCYIGTSETFEFRDLKDRISSDLIDHYPKIQKEAESKNERGILRTLRWGQKVSTLQATLIDRYLEKGEKLLEGKDLFVCEACGFVFLGDGAPDICPVCKAPKMRFSKM